MLEVYVFEDADGNPFGEWKTQDYREAVAYAREHGLALIARQYEYVDSEMIEDYRPKKRRRGRAPRC